MCFFPSSFHLEDRESAWRKCVLGENFQGFLWFLMIQLIKFQFCVLKIWAFPTFCSFQMPRSFFLLNMFWVREKLITSSKAYEVYQKREESKVLFLTLSWFYWFQISLGCVAFVYLLWVCCSFLFHFAPPLMRFGVDDAVSFESVTALPVVFAAMCRHIFWTRDSGQYQVPFICGRRKGNLLLHFVPCFIVWSHDSFTIRLVHLTELWFNRGM